MSAPPIARHSGFAAGVIFSMLIGILCLVLYGAVSVLSNVGDYREPTVFIRNDTTDELFLFADGDEYGSHLPEFATDTEIRELARNYEGIWAGSGSFTLAQVEPEGGCLYGGRLAPAIVTSASGARLNGRGESPPLETIDLSDVETLYTFPSDFCITKQFEDLHWNGESLEPPPSASKVALLKLGLLLFGGPPLIGLALDHLRRRWRRLRTPPPPSSPPPPSLHGDVARH